MFRGFWRRPDEEIARRIEAWAAGSADDFSRKGRRKAKKALRAIGRLSPEFQVRILTNTNVLDRFLGLGSLAQYRKDRALRFLHVIDTLPNDDQKVSVMASGAFSWGICLTDNSDAARAFLNSIMKLNSEDGKACVFSSPLCVPFLAKHGMGNGVVSFLRDGTLENRRLVLLSLRTIEWLTPIMGAQQMRTMVAQAFPSGDEREESLARAVVGSPDDDKIRFLLSPDNLEAMSRRDLFSLITRFADAGRIDLDAVLPPASDLREAYDKAIRAEDLREAERRLCEDRDRADSDRRWCDAAVTINICAAVG